MTTNQPNFCNYSVFLTLNKLKTTAEYTFNQVLFKYAVLICLSTFFESMMFTCQEIFLHNGIVTFM